MTDDERAERRRLTALRRRANKARSFPANTCPASRHVHIMADTLARYGTYPMLAEDPHECAGAMLAVVAALWEARTKLALHPAICRAGRTGKPAAAPKDAAPC